MQFRFPFRRDNRRPDGFWDLPDATDDNIKGTSIDPYDPVWPRWKQAPPEHGEGEFISDDPFCADAGKMTPPRAMSGSSGSMFGAVAKFG